MRIHRGQNPASIRLNNIRLMVNVIRQEDNITIPELAKKVRLSKTTVWKTVDYFIQNELIVNIGKGNTSEEGGKKPDLFKFNKNFGYIITIALYGHYISCALADANANIFHEERVNIKVNESLERVVSIIVSLIDKWQNPTKYIQETKNLIGIVFALSGVVDSKKGVVFTSSRFRSWPQNAPLLEKIKEQVELKAPYYIDNYNRYSVYGEKAKGSFESFSDIFMIFASENGVGGAMISDNEIQRGHNYLIGEVGHMKINSQDTERCHCGGYGCFEQQISIERLLNRAKSLGANYPDSELNNESELNLQSIFDYSNKNDVLATKLIDEIALWFAIAFQTIALTIDPQLILIGGSYKTAGKYLIKKIKEYLKEVSLVDMEKRVTIDYSEYGDEGVLIGGACYGFDTYFNNYQIIE
ncbi:MAG: ROK family protein [Sphaerochaetaceae bacterium]|jgi:predicted NBD/HSP70 family sugar kinase